MDEKAHASNADSTTLSPDPSVTFYTRYAEYANLARELALASIKQQAGTGDAAVENTAMAAEADRKFQAWYQYFLQLQLHGASAEHWFRSKSQGVPCTSAGGSNFQTVTQPEDTSTHGQTQSVMQVVTTGDNQPPFAALSPPTCTPLEEPATIVSPSVYSGMDVSQQLKQSAISTDTNVIRVTNTNATAQPQLTQNKLHGSVEHGVFCLNQLLQQQQQLLLQEQRNEMFIGSFPVTAATCVPSHNVFTSRDSPGSYLASYQGVARIPTVEATNSLRQTAFKTTIPNRGSSNVASSVDLSDMKRDTLADYNELNIPFDEHRSRGAIQNSISCTGIPPYLTAGEELEQGRQNARDADAHYHGDPLTHVVHQEAYQPSAEHSRSRFLLRVTRINYQCSCLASFPTELSKNVDRGDAADAQAESRRKEPCVYVVFQASLPSLKPVFRSETAGPSTQLNVGLRLEFTCAFSREEPLLPDFTEPKLIERLGSWEQAGNMPGFRWQILSALRTAAASILERIRKGGFSAIELDKDYVFYPLSREFRLCHSRGRQKSSSVDSCASNRYSATHQPNDSSRLGVMAVEQNEEMRKGEHFDQGYWLNTVSSKEESSHHQQPTVWHENQSQGHRLLGNLPTDLVYSCDPKLVPTPCDERSHMEQTYFDPNATHWTTLRKEPALARAGKYRSVADSMPGLVNRKTEELEVPYRRLLTNTRSMSTPASPTRFPSSLKTQHELRRNSEAIGKRTEYAPLSTENHRVRVTVSQPTADTVSQKIPEGRGSVSSHQVQAVIREVTRRLHTHPHLPIVVMPWSVPSTEDRALTSGTKEIIPIVFQLPQPNSTFVCLNTLEQSPRVLIAPKGGTLIVLSPTPEEAEKGKTCAQPTVITGPKPGYLLLITSDNRYIYVPINQTE